jgi:integrase
MATIKQYQKKNGEKAWYFKTYLGIDPITGKKQTTTRRGFKTQKEAKIALARLEVQAKDNKYIPQKNITFGEVAELWLKKYKTTVKASSYLRVSAIFNSNILPKFKEKRINKITIPYCQKVVSEWHNEYKTYKSIRTYTSSVFDYAVELKFLDDNPMKHVPIPKQKKEYNEKKAFFEKDELEEFLEYCKKDSYPLTYPIFRVLSFTGIRKGELSALTWNDIDFTNATLTVNKTMARSLNGFEVTPPKTYSSERIISLDAITVDVLKKWRVTQKKYLLSFGINSLQPNQLVFPSKTNRPISYPNINKLLKKICVRYNLKSISVHGFRHTHCSLLFEAGLSVKEVQYRLGHASPRTTLEIYAHVTKGQKEKIAEKFASYVSF